MRSIGSSEKPYVDVEGKGQVIFDVALGVPIRIKSRRKLTLNQGTVTIEVPVLIDCKRVALANTIAERLGIASSSAQRRKERAEKVATASNTSGTERLQTLLKKIAQDFAKDGRSHEVRKLSGMQVVPEKRSEVVKMLKKIIASTTGYSTGEAVKALGVWGTDKEVPVLVKLLRSGDSTVQRSAGEALGSIGGKAAVEPLVKLLLNGKGSQNYQWERCLESIGQVAETDVLKLLDSSDSETMESAVKILTKIGGQKSVRPLEKLLARAEKAGRSFSIQKYNVQRALKECQSRAVAKEIGGGIDRLAMPKRSAQRLSGVDRDLQQLDEAIATLKQGGTSTGRYSALSHLSRLPPVEAKRKEVVELIEPSLGKRTKGTELRAAVTAIGVWGDATHAKHLLRLIPDAKPSERTTLFQSLGKIGDEKTSDDLLEYLKDEENGFQAVAGFRELSKETEKELESWLTNDKVYQRAKAVTVLGKAGGRTVGARLRKFLKKEADTIAFTQAIQALAAWEVRQ